MSQVVYIKRDKQGKICALYARSAAGTEQMDMDAPEVLEFLNRCDKENRFKLTQSDLQLIRVLEDLIEILISKNVITITDFPQVVIDKLVERQRIRKHLTGAVGMEFDNEM
ncbi:TPA: hypothetical protein ACPSKE_000067 [Legionella feeleii]|uniref:hypothetical protein n=1 Tax=Legionella feeleii TaxID=453 RepID=UPI001EE7058F|nr:hypothetical protein [Legionella feeleii]